MGKITYEPGLGETIESAAKTAATIAWHRSNGHQVFLKFNDIVIPADLCSHRIMDAYKAECNRRAEAYRQSDEGKRAAREREERKAEAQRKVDDLMRELPHLDFRNLNEVISWVERLQPASDHAGVIVPVNVVIGAFREHGFEANANTGDAFDGNDERNYAGCVVGQALDGLSSMGAIHPMVVDFADRWRTLFRK